MSWPGCLSTGKDGESHLVYDLPIRIQRYRAGMEACKEEMGDEFEDIIASALSGKSNLGEFLYYAQKIRHEVRLSFLSNDVP